MSSFLDYSTAGQTSNNPLPISSTRAPTTSDVLSPTGEPYNIGRLWVNTSTKILYFYVGGGTWTPLSTSASGSINTITGDSGGAEVPSSNNFNLLGTANQITVTGSANTETFSLPAAITAPGSLTTTTTLASGTTLAAGTSMSSGTSITAGTTLTATLGAITATNGNIVRGTAGNKDVYSSVASTTTAGANSAGTVTLVGGTATVATTAVTASSQVRLYRQSIGATGAAALGILSLGTVTAGVSFVINAVQAANATALQASDVSVIGWEIVN